MSAALSAAGSGEFTPFEVACLQACALDVQGYRQFFKGTSLLEGDYVLLQVEAEERLESLGLIDGNNDITEAGRVVLWALGVAA